jgi:hypothetical protein
MSTVYALVMFIRSGMLRGDFFLFIAAPGPQLDYIALDMGNSPDQSPKTVRELARYVCGRVEAIRKRHLEQDAARCVDAE